VQEKSGKPRGVYLGCQIFLGKPYRNREECTKAPQNVPNGHKIYRMVETIKAFSISRQNIPKLEFLV
jgi:hypothetical protein